MNNFKQLYSIIANPKKIHFWIIIFFIIRLYGITNPPLEVAHNWRQTTVTMVARNFFEVDANIFYPRIDIAGEKSGITGMEFPFFNYLIYLVSIVFGYQHWYGRLINLIVSSFGIFFFSLLVKKHFSERISLFASIILLVSIWFAYSRKIMPDTFSVSFTIIGLYYGSNYLESNYKKIHLLLAYFVFTTLGVLSKLPSGHLLILYMPLLLINRGNTKAIILFIISSVVSVFIIGAWYYFWVPYLVKEYGFWHFFMGNTISAGTKEIIENLNLTLSRFYETALKYIGFFVFLFGLANAFYKKNKKLTTIFILSFFSFLIIILKAGFTFSRHSYYIIPFVPIMALIAGYGLDTIKSKKVVLPILIIISLEGVLNQQHDFRIKDKETALLNLETDLNEFSNNNDLIVINSNEYPTPMYFAHRKGWVANNEDLLNKDYIEKLKENGLKQIIILKKSFGIDINLPYEKNIDNSNYTIYTP